MPASPPLSFELWTRPSGVSWRRAREWYPKRSTVSSRPDVRDQALQSLLRYKPRPWRQRTTKTWWKRPGSFSPPLSAAWRSTSAGCRLGRWRLWLGPLRWRSVLQRRQLLGESIAMDDGVHGVWEYVSNWRNYGHSFDHALRSLGRHLLSREFNLKAKFCHLWYLEGADAKLTVTGELIRRVRKLTS